MTRPYTLLDHICLVFHVSGSNYFSKTSSRQVKDASNDQNPKCSRLFVLFYVTNSKRTRPLDVFYKAVPLINQQQQWKFNPKNE